MNKKNKMENNKEIEYTSLPRVFLSAGGFYVNYKNIREKIENSKPISSENILPVAICSAFFAIELYLKLIHGFAYWEKYEKIKANPENITCYPNGHNLYKLFNDLDKENQNLIFEKLSNKCSKERFLNSLNEYKDGFIEWRYIFENDKNMHVNLCSIDYILEALYKVSSYCINNYSPRKEWSRNNPEISATYKEECNVSLIDIEKILREESGK